MINIDIAVVILHYLNYKDTLECVASFQSKLDTDKYTIIVVDNASPDHSGQKLLDYYRNEEMVEVLLNDTNLGFSAGNNVGIQYIRNRYDAKYIVVSNNDIVLFDERLYLKINEAYDSEEFAVMGPMVLTADGRFDSNPIFDLPYTYESALWQLSENRKRLRQYENIFFPINIKCASLMKALSRRLGFEMGYNSMHRKIDRSALWLKKRDGVVLHGCFLIFTRQYFEKFDGFDARTFLYAEEDILYQHMIHNKLKMLYNPEIVVFHKEGKSVGSISDNSKERLIFKTKQQIKAIEAYIDLLNQFDSLSKE